MLSVEAEAALMAIGRGEPVHASCRRELPILAAFGLLEAREYPDGRSYVLTPEGRDRADELLGWRFENGIMIDDGGNPPAPAPPGSPVGPVTVEEALRRRAEALAPAIRREIALGTNRGVLAAVLRVRRADIDRIGGA